MEQKNKMGKNSHTLSPERVIQEYDSREEGLTEEEAEKRLEKYGRNKIEKEEGISPLRMFLSEFNDPLVLLLVGALVISFFIHHIIDGIVIGLIVVINAIIGFVQEYRAEKSLEALKEMLEPTTVVIREGHKKEIPAEEVVPGDIISLEAGDRVSADARLISKSNLETQEAPLTGESTPVTKKADLKLESDTPLAERKNMVFMGTTVTRGVGKAIVTQTSMQSAFGDIAHEVQRVEREETPLMRKIGQFGKKLTIIIIIITLAAAIVEYYQTRQAIQSFMVAVGLAISAVPEGLPAVVTITLALGMGTMAEKNAILRKLSSVETLGSTTVICSDKTGTMTRNEMTVKKAYVSGTKIQVTGTGYNPEGKLYRIHKDTPDDKQKIEVQDSGGKDDALIRMLRTFALCNNADLVYDEENGHWNIVGDPTEGAFLTFARKGGVVREKELNEYPEIHENPFSSARKMMSTVHKTSQDEKIAFVKGAPEEVLKKSTHIYENGEVKKLTLDKKREIIEKVEEMSKKALRVLAAAYKPVKSEDYKIEAIEQELIFLGTAGMIDPPRPNVGKSIERCREAGIEVKMVTGDHLATAEAIAEGIGLLEEEEGKERSMTGRKVKTLSDEELQEAVKKVKVFARVSPQHKVRIATALKENGEIVAMTGDGVNDAPAVKRADIGVSMGIKGTEVTREASDMVLADDDFATIVTAVEEGRGIYGNIRKFLRYLLESNFDEILLIGIAAFLVYETLPLKPLQILWLNIATDGLPATALAFDTYGEGLMERGPRDPDEGLLQGMLLFVLVGAIMQFSGSFLLFHFGLNVWNAETVNTMVFCEAIGFELSSVWNCRSERHSVWTRGMENFKNKLFVLGVLVNIPLLALLIYYPPLQVIFDTVALNWKQLLISVSISSIGLLLLPEVFMRSSKREVQT